MKFLCEQCKAKYQIADDKVAGKTVRMKCRKCGHMIEVRAEVTETSVAKGLPAEDGKKPATAAKGPPKSGLATSLSTARPPAPKGKPDALAGAFQKKVRADAESTSSLEILDSSTANGWYVAINGVPVGPIRISEMRRKAANGAVTEDSLVWREGLEEWRPVRSVTELAEIVREAMTSGRPSLVTPPPGDYRASAPPPAPAAPSPSSMAPRPPARPAPAAPRAPEPPQRAAPLAARSNVVPFTGRLATAEKREEAEDIDIDEELEPVSSDSHSHSASALAAIAAPAASSPVLPSPLPERPSLVAADPFGPAAPPVTRQPSAPVVTPAPLVAVAAPMPASASIALSPPVVVTEPAGESKRGGLNPIALGMILAFMGFGITAAYFMFKKDPPQQPQVIIVPQPAQPGVAVAPTAPTASSGEQVIELPDTVPNKPSNGGKVATGPKPTTQGTGGNKLGLDPSLIGGSGPNVGGGSTGGGATGGHRSEDSIQSTVRGYQTGVRRTCWERLGVQTPSVNINTKISIDSGGNVSSVEANGNDPTVAKCIETQVKNWKFGPGDSVTVNVPFKFVRQ